jgi:predicted nucleic acid-binding protein
VKGEVFIDSGVFIAFLVRRDRLHEQAVELFASPPPRWSTSVLVVAETYGWFLHRLGEDEARTFRGLLDQLPGLAILDTDEDHRRAVWKKLDRLRGVPLTYVDASSLVWIEQRKISAVWATDSHLAIEGASVVPGPPPS